MIDTDGLLADILRREGGYTNHPADRGGPTKFGITAKTLGEYRGLGRAALDVEVMALTEEDARAIYWNNYIIKPGFNKLPDSTGAQRALVALLVDSAVNSGPAMAVRWLQDAVNATLDGVLGPGTLEAVNRMDSAIVYRLVLASRVCFVGQLISKNCTQSVFAAGWAARLAEFVRNCP